MGRTYDFLHWSLAQGWRPLLFRYCTHESHQHRKHFYSRMKGYRLYQRDWTTPFVTSLSSNGIQLNPDEQICEADLLAEWSRQQRGEVYRA